MSRADIPEPPATDTEETRPATPAAVQNTLDQVLSSPHFRNSLQSRNLLTYIVKHTLSREEHLLRERVIGADVFGRPVDYEASQDPVVRLRAAEVRKRLAQFYQSTPELPSVYIEIPSGGYRATFQLREERSQAIHRNDDAVSTSGPVPESPCEETPLAIVVEPEIVDAVAPAVARKRSWIGKVVTAVLLVAAVAVGAWFWRAPDNSAFLAFWAPWAKSPRPALIAIGSNAVYRLSGSFTDRYAAVHGLQSQGADFYVPFAPDANIRGSDLTPGYNSFIALGDVSAVSDIVASLTRQGKAFQERFPNDYSFAELRNAPSILVGGFNNPMTLELTKHLGFVLRNRREIDDTASPGRRWVLHAPDDSRYTEDYAIITRLYRQGEAPLLSVAGLGQYGTVAAAEYVSNPASLFTLSRSLPKGWAAKNLQVVLHVKVVDFRVASTEVVAARSW